MSYYKYKGLSILFIILKVLVFLIPLAVFMIMYKEIFFERTDNVLSITGLGIIGLVLYVMGLKHMLGKIGYIWWFVIVFLICLCASYLGEYLMYISLLMLIGACCSLPFDTLIRRYSKMADTVDDANIREKIKTREVKKRNRLTEEDVSGRV